jgi:hypothetical protein
MGLRGWLRRKLGLGALWRIHWQLERLLIAVCENNWRIRIMAGELTLLQTEVQETKAAIADVLAYLVTIKTKLDEAIANGDPAALTALSAELDAEQAKLRAVLPPVEPPVEPPVA